MTVAAELNPDPEEDDIDNGNAKSKEPTRPSKENEKPEPKGKRDAKNTVCDWRYCPRLKLLFLISSRHLQS